MREKMMCNLLSLVAFSKQTVGHSGQNWGLKSKTIDLRHKF
jgi:hypothetical protein